MNNESQPVTRLLRQWSSGDKAALEQLMPLIYEELRRIAGVYMRKERSDHTLTPTALVGEAFVRLCAMDNLEFADRLQFFALAARQMRRILVDHARRRFAGKRGGKEARSVCFDETLLATDRPEPLIALDDALDALSKADERKARVIDLRYFGGLELKEIALVLSVHENTVARDLRLAEAWIHRHMSSPE